MKKLLIGRSPGLDGLPVEFYRKMWPNIKLDFLEMVKEVRNTKNLSDSQKKGHLKGLLDEHLLLFLFCL